MTKCNAGEYPYCTQHVREGEPVCDYGHLQAGASVALPGAAISGAMHLHFSGYDPRAAGGRQSIKLELRGALAQTLARSVTKLDVQLRSELIVPAQARQHFVRTASGLWRPLLIGFSSKNREYGQYQIEIEISQQAPDAGRRRWTCTAVILVPRPDTTLTEIHRVFLGTQKNIKVIAEDGSIAKLSGFGAEAGMDLDIRAGNAAIAQVDLSAAAGKYEIAPGSIAWDEELIEECIDQCIDECLGEPNPAVPQATPVAESKPARHSALLISAVAQSWRQIRLFALDQWVLGRMELQHPRADILLAHRGKEQAASALLTRRISARHAIIRRCGDGAQITDISRYGLLLDGAALEKNLPVALHTGMQIELCASVREIVCLRVSAVLGHLVLLQGSGTDASDELFYLLTPETRPDPFLQNFPTSLPLIFHAQGQFWHRDCATGAETALRAGSMAEALQNLARGSRYLAAPYADPPEGDAYYKNHMT